MSDLAEQVLERVKNWIEEARQKGYSLADSADVLVYELEGMIDKDEKNES